MSTVVTAHNGAGPDATQPLTVQGSHITPAASTGFSESQPGTFTVTTDATGGAAFTETRGWPSAAGMSFVDNDPTTQTASRLGRPVLGTVGWDIAVTMVSNGVTVTPVVRPHRGGLEGPAVHHLR